MSEVVAKAEVLEAKIAAFIANAQQNDEKHKRFRDLEMRILNERTLDGLLTQIVTDCAKTCRLDGIALALLDPEYECRRLAPKLADNTCKEIQLLDSSDALRRIVKTTTVALESFDTTKHASYFDKELSAELQSMAVIPLSSNEHFLGVLLFASRDPNRYQPNIETYFLDHLSAVIGVSLQNALNQARVKLLGLVDPLTQVYNRRYFDERLQEEVTRVSRTHAPLSCLYLDIDLFKKVNDTHGHAAGDEVLIAVASEMQHDLRPVDVLSRYGGEEFVALLVDTSYEDALCVAERVRARIENLTIDLSSSNAHALTMSVTISVGVATLDNADSTNGRLSNSSFLNQADQSLYRAKQSGRNCVVGWSEIVQQAAPAVG